MSTQQHSLTQSSTLPPAQPSYILRGHSAQIHAIRFLRQNLRLLTGDADGWVVLWDVPIKRPIAVWKAHKNAILGLDGWGDDKILTHGRDGKLNVWQLRQKDETDLSKVLPIDDATSERKQPWLLHALPVHALNFCSFAMCKMPDQATSRSDEEKKPDGILIATPGIQDGFINLTSLPSEERLATIPTPKDTNTGMIMAIGLQHHENCILVLAGYEDGHACVWKQDKISKKWQTAYINKSHSQPILSLDAASTINAFFTSSADANVARHPLGSETETKIQRTKHAGQQALTVRSDEKMFATAGWDGRARVYSSKTMKELAVLKWHKEGCYALAFAEILDGDGVNSPADNRPAEEGTGFTKRDLTVSEQRTARAKTTHWVAAGSKDGKVSLWDVY